MTNYLNGSYTEEILYQKSVHRISVKILSNPGHG